MTLNGVMAITLHYFSEFGKPVLQKTICGGIYARVKCIFTACTISYKESSRSLSHLLMSFLFCWPGYVPCFGYMRSTAIQGTTLDQVYHHLVRPIEMQQNTRNK